jgi:hypothetical protein
MNENNLLDVISSPFSSLAQIEQAEFTLHKLRNPERPAHVEPTVVEPGGLMRYEWGAGLIDSDIGEDGTPAHQAWIAGADLWLKSIVENSQYSTDQKREAQERHACHTKPNAQRHAEEDTIDAARSADKAELRARVQADHPGWNGVQISNEMLDMSKAEGNVTWKFIDGVPTKIRFDEKWTTWEKSESLPEVQLAPVAVVPPVTTPSQNDRTTNQQIQRLLSDEHRLGIEPSPQVSPKVPKLSALDQLMADERAARDRQQAEASRKWNAQMGLPPGFQPGGFKGDN